MDRKEFWMLQRSDPVKVWRILATQAKSEQVKKLYEEFARLEEERSISNLLTTSVEEEERSEAQRLLMLAQDGPNKSERLEWWLGNVWSKVKPKLATLAKGFLDFMGFTWGAWVVFSALVSWIEVFGAGPGFYVVVALIVTVVLAAFLDSEVKRLYKPYVTLATFLWLGVASYLSFGGTIASDYIRNGGDKEDFAPHSGYLIRDHRVMNVASFVYDDNDFLPKTMPSRRPFVDSFQWVEHLKKEFSLELPVMNGENPHQRHLYLLKVTYWLEPMRVAKPVPIASSSMEDVEMGEASRVQALLRRSVAELPKPISTLPPDEYFRKALGEFKSNLFQLKILKMEHIQSALEVESEGQWYRVNSPETPKG